MTASLVFRAVSAPEPGARMAELFARAWPAYRSWFLAGEHAPPSFLLAREALREHMPELVPTWERLVEACGGGDLEARFLALYCPPPYAAACSQAAWTAGEPTLMRNYDYRPGLCDGVLLGSAWMGRRVLAMTDCLWGALDGVNEAGLCVSLTFGGTPDVGPGFGVPLVLRYVLETASTTPEATAILRRVPVHMSHNVTALDAAGRVATVFLGPGRAAVVSQRPYATNHQETVAWQAYADATATVEREAFLAARLADTATSEALLETFLAPPLHRTVDRGWGTLYTAAYRPARGEMELRWPGRRWRHSLAADPHGEVTITYGAGA